MVDKGERMITSLFYIMANVLLWLRNANLMLGQSFTCAPGAELGIKNCWCKITSKSSIETFLGADLIKNVWTDLKMYVYDRTFQK